MGSICSQPSQRTPFSVSQRAINKPIKKGFTFSAGQFVQENYERFQSVYTLHENSIGTGAFAEVWLCTHKRTKDVRAVKIFEKSSLTEYEIQTRSVFNEVEILKTLDHPNILKVFEYFEDTEKCYIVMEFCEGGDLFDRIEAEGTFTERYAAKVMRLLLAGLNYLHTKQVVHRDIKPENILITNKGKYEDFNIKIIDFNIATVKKERKIRGVSGTTDYMAPEVFRGIYDERCDLWSSGVLLYVMISGNLPFPSPNDEAAEKAICEGKYIFPRNLFAGVSNSCKDLIAKLLLKNPGSRLSAQEALNHPWVKRSEEKLDTSNLSATMTRISEYKTSGKLKEVFTTFMISQLMNNSALKQLEKAFYAIDVNHDGVISKDELVKQLSLDMSKEEAEAKANQMMSIIDNDGSGEIDYTEFLTVAIDKKILLTKENLKKAFLYFDKDGSNAIEKSELHEWLTDGDIIPEHLIAELMREADSNNDGTIDLEEFEALLISKLDLDY